MARRLLTALFVLATVAGCVADERQKPSLSIFGGAMGNTSLPSPYVRQALPPLDP